MLLSKLCRVVGSRICAGKSFHRNVKAAAFSSVNKPPSIEADYIIVGAGSAGCVLASRLSEDTNKTVLLLEAGHSDMSTPTDLLLHMPTALAMPMHYDRYNYKFLSEPENESLGGRRIACPRGKGLGGSSSINGMVYVRGHPEDFNTWETMGAKNWSYRHVLPYFRKAETWQGGENKYRGGNGPLHVKFGENHSKTPLHDAFLKAGVEAGFPLTEDYNAEHQEGVGKMAMTIFHSGPQKGLRCSTSNAYLRPIMKSRSNLRVLPNAMASRIIFNSDKHVQSLEVINSKTSEVFTVKAKSEIILSAGSIQTPQLLQVSGIGDRHHLSSLNVPIIHHNPHVGKNFQDHMELYVQQESKSRTTLAPYASNPIRKALVGARWILFRDGLGASNHFETCAFLKSSPEATYPDVQFHFLPIAISYDGVSLAPSQTGHSYQIHVGTCRSASRGHVKARSNDVRNAPEIRFNYMSQKKDWIDMRNAIRLARKIISQPSLTAISGAEIQPGSERQRDEDLDAFIRKHIESAYHPCGTCKMGEADDAVVDSEGRVKGVSGLRVADASVFPQVTNGNLNAPVIMVAERIADLIKGKVLPPVNI